MLGLGSLVMAAQPALAQRIDPDFDKAFDAVPKPQPVQPATTSSPVVQALPVLEPVMQWGAKDAAALLRAIDGIEAEGLIAADYQPEKLRAAIAAGPGAALDKAASTAFAWLVEDLRDGRTPMTARVQWFAVDPDQDDMPTADLMAMALQSHDVPGVLASLNPNHPDYAALKAELAATP